MSGLNHRLRGSTLVETLVMMLVAGIVFLSVMDGLRLFTRLQIQRTDALLASGREADGYYRLSALVANADSIGTYGDNLELFRAGRRAVLTLHDSMAIYLCGEFRDTLAQHIGKLRLSSGDLRPDTVEIGFAAGFTAKFPIQEPLRERYFRSLEQIEHEYGYEEE